MAVSSIAWLLIPFLPLVLGVGLAVPRLRDSIIRVASWAAVPAVIVAVLPASPPDSSVPWLLIDTQLGLEPITRSFLLLTGLLWTAAGVYAGTYMDHDRNRHRFWLFFLLTMSGNLGLVIALDVASFYFSFALMTFAAFGLIVHEGSDDARHAAQIYMIMGVLGEVMMLVSFILLAFEANTVTISALADASVESPYRPLIIGLLLGGFGVKAGAIPLHIWLPLAHPVAPTPASAVLSGAMLKAGLLGWLRFLPVGDVSMQVWGVLIIVLGLGAAVAAAVAGAVQSDPKTVLAYSSISQMGIISTGVGAVMVEPAAWPAMGVAVAFYALHHGLAKGALFLGVGVVNAGMSHGWQRRAVGMAMVIPALALAGAPLTSGAAAKNALKDALVTMEGEWEQWLTWWLLIAAIGTTVLMIRFLYLMRPAAVTGDPHHPLAIGLWGPWAALVLASAVSAVVAPELLSLPGVEPLHLEVTYLWQGVWPVLSGVGIALAAVSFRRRGRFQTIRDLPAGDILVVGEAASVLAMRPIRGKLLPTIRLLEQRSEGLLEASRVRSIGTWILDLYETRLVHFRTAGLILVGLMVAMFVLVWSW